MQCHGGSERGRFSSGNAGTCVHAGTHIYASSYIDSCPPNSHTGANVHSRANANSAHRHCGPYGNHSADGHSPTDSGANGDPDTYRSANGCANSGTDTGTNRYPCANGHARADCHADTHKGTAHADSDRDADRLLDVQRQRYGQHGSFRFAAQTALGYRLGSRGDRTEFNGRDIDGP